MAAAEVRRFTKSASGDVEPGRNVQPAPARSFSVAGQQFYVNLIITDAKTQELVAFKVDGRRFDTSAKTLKFYTGNTYQLLLSTKPCQQLSRIVIGGREVELKPKPGDDGVFIGQWTVHVQPLKKGKREDIHCIIEGGFGKVDAIWQCKFYDLSVQNGAWGEKLAGLNYKCSLCEGGYRITDESYQ